MALQLSCCTMALSLLNPQLRLNPSFPHRRPLILSHHNKPHFATNTKLRFRFPTVYPENRNSKFFLPKSASVNGFSVQNIPVERERDTGENDVEFPERFRRWVAFIRSFMPGGSWWRFSDDVEVVFTAKPVTVFRALRRMWDLVAKDRWVIFGAFTALIFAALSEISIPHFLAASIFSAQSGETMVFHRNVQLLVLLCITSGICRSKSCMVKIPFYYEF
ncbi:hypothetical protein HHK36_007450 [Tetracentron sinense]|uniref:Uncharacterized protein n=1 Tax=Tetracentron sinense TaxID=13715 RepID=A0A835DQ44_TETSI|nr:hypothetical protein HHK36_007450 [Tetracentron sinense]